MHSSLRKTFREAFSASIPVMAGYVVLGMGFGVLLSTKGYGPLWALAMSGFIYAGSFAAIQHPAEHRFEQHPAANLLLFGFHSFAVAGSENYSSSHQKPPRQMP